MTAGSNFAGYKSNFQNFMFYIINFKISYKKKKKALYTDSLKEEDPFVQSFLKLK